MKVLYIGGAGRSGSTLLEKIIGNSPDFVSFGEVRYFWEYLASGEMCCGCGSNLVECDFWSQVIALLAKNPEVDHKRMAFLSKKLNRTHHLLQMKIRQKVGKTKEWQELVRGTAALYQAIHQVSGEKVIVDASKVPSHLIILMQISGIDIRLLHLVRDGRGVAYSLNKRKKKELGVKNKIVYMPQRSLFRSMITWIVENFISLELGRQLPSAVMRYEDFVQSPYKVLTQTLSTLKVPDGDFSQLKSPCINLQYTHSIGGNPIRFKQDTIIIRASEEWQQNMSSICKVGLGLLGLPLFLKFHYSLT